ncbi:autophagy-related protein 23, putative [Plasmodium relictum]|uniref:Autophagy-related protein 23, putative n=1 Tax=Plasmodium relictum TaxID=85471 RepID=A0A1J1H629_PLARL|nr:autophagy-related protein 23, putative [Plasmodium relictum]CRH00137.1 autophagy-related protein 23, putative [Plasmodium relictum]
MVKRTNDLQNKDSFNDELLLEIQKIEAELKKKNDEYEELNDKYRDIYDSYVLIKNNLEETTNNYEGEILKLETILREKENEHMDFTVNFQELLEEKCKLDRDIKNYEKAIYEINENLISLKETHKEELKEIQDENTNLYAQIEKFNGELKIMKTKNQELEKINEEEKKTLKEEKDKIKIEQNKIEEKRVQLEKKREEIKKEKEKIEKEREEIKKEKEKVEKESEEIKKEKEKVEKERDEIEKERDEIKKEKEQIKKEKHELEYNMKNMIIINDDLKNEVDILKAEILKIECNSRETEKKADQLENENKMFKNEIEKKEKINSDILNEMNSLDSKLKELKNVMEDKQDEVLKRDSIIQILYNKLKEKENQIILFQNENLSLKNSKKELNKKLDDKRSEMDKIDNKLHEKLAILLIKKKVKERNDLHFDGHPYSSLLKILWNGYVDICKCILKTRDAYLYSGNKDHRFISAYDTDLFLDIKEENENKGLLSYKNETRGIFKINEEEIKNLIYIGPFNKFNGYNVGICNDKNNLEVSKCNMCSYIFEEIYETKKGTKLVLIKEKESGKYLSGLNRNLYFDKKKKGVDKLDYINVVSKLINYITNETEDNENIIIKTSDKKLKIESETKTCLVKKSDPSITEEKNEKKKNIIREKIYHKNEKKKNTKLTNIVNKNEIAEQEMNEENMHNYKIAKDMLLISNSNSSTENESVFSLKNKNNDQNEFTHNVLNKSIATNYIGNANMSFFNSSNNSDYNNTNVLLTTNKNEAILFEIFNYEQIVEHDAIKFASECILHFLLNSNHNLQSISNKNSEENSNYFSTIDGEWCILPAYL